jgi:hypothetical protein
MQTDSLYILEISPPLSPLKNDKLWYACLQGCVYRAMRRIFSAGGSKAYMPKKVPNI